MAKFEFRLATLMRLRENHRDELRGKLAEAYQAEQLLAEKKQSIHEEEDKLHQLRRDLLQEANTDVNRLLDMQRYAATLKAQLATIQEQAKMLSAEVEKRRLAVVQADQQVKVLEKLRDKQLSKHRQQKMLAEAKELDEIGSRTVRASI